jgi:hypothetical protein
MPDKQTMKQERHEALRPSRAGRIVPDIFKEFEGR